MGRRPALSGTRALRVLNIMASAPEREFSLSEIVRCSEINIASSHAILGTLVEYGYLSRDDVKKTYRLGPALYASGQAMLENDPLLKAVLTSGGRLAEQTGLSVRVSVRVGFELVGISRHGGESLIGPGLPVGRRVPLKPPIGATLIAWSTDEEIDAWIERGGIGNGTEGADKLRAELSAIRRRGFLATLNTDSYAEISAVYSNRFESTAEYSGNDALHRALFGGLFQPAKIDDSSLYDLAYIGAPIFDRRGIPLYSIILSGFQGQIDGRTIEAHALDLKRTCTDIMRSSSSDLTTRIV